VEEHRFLSCKAAEKFRIISGMTGHLKIPCGLALPCFCGSRWRDGFLRAVCQVVLALPLVFSLADSARAADALAAETRDESSTYRLQAIPPDARKGLGSWIWKDKTFDHQACRLWKDFDIPKDAKVVEARMRITVDDGYQMYLDGRELSQGANWRSITEYDLTLLLTPGRHVLAISAFNDYFAAGLLMDFRVVLADGRVVEIKSDESWKVVPEGVRNWEKIKRPQPGWQSATIITPHPLWTHPSWPEDYIRVPRFQPLVIPFWQTGWFYLLLASVSGLVFLACIALLFQVAFQKKEQRLLNQERARIARDIHDDFGTRLTRLVLESEVAQNELPEEAVARHQFSLISDGLREALGAMDEVLWAVNPRHDTVGDFVTYVCEYAQEYLRSADIQCLLEVEPDMPPLEFDLPLRRSLLLAVKEAVNNAAKHSGATCLLLRIQRQDSGLNVIVEDDGKGFDPTNTSGKRNGIGNMIQRMSEVGGRCVVISQPGKGCRVEFSIPLTRQPSRLGWLTRRWRKRLESEGKSVNPPNPETADKQIIEP
jgi:signal transduction histidine kinase